MAGGKAQNAASICNKMIKDIFSKCNVESLACRVRKERLSTFVKAKLFYKYRRNFRGNSSSFVADGNVDNVRASRISLARNCAGG